MDDKCLAEKKIPEDCDISIIVNCFKNMDNATERENYRGLNSLEHMNLKKKLNKNPRGG